MRLSREKLFEITGFKTPNKQVEWFKKCLGILVPFDRAGPILTPATYEAILAKRLGVFPSVAPTPDRDDVVVHMRKPTPSKVARL